MTILIDDTTKETRTSLITPPPVERRKCCCSAQLEVMYKLRRDITLEKMVAMEKAILALDFATKNLERIKRDLGVLTILELDAYLSWQKSLPEGERHAVSEYIGD